MPNHASVKLSRRALLKLGMAAGTTMAAGPGWRVFAGPDSSPALAASTTSPIADGEWPAYARDPGGMRHSPQTQINRGNVGQLKVAWTF